MSQDAEPTPLNKLLALLDQAVQTDELSYEFSEVIELDPDVLVAKLFEMVKDNTVSVCLRAVAILVLDRLPYSYTEEKDEFEQLLSNALEPILQDKSNAACVRAASAFVLYSANSYIMDPSVDDETTQFQSALREGVLQTDLPIVAILSTRLLTADSILVLLPQLIHLMQFSDHSLAEAALDCLNKIGPAGDPAIPAHLEMLNQDDQVHRYQLLCNLGRIGTRPEQTIPILLQIINTPESEDFGVALNSLMKIVSYNDHDATDYLQMLKKFLGEKTGAELLSILGAISTLGVKARPIRPLVKVLDRHPDKSIASQARSTLRAMRLPKKDAATD